MSDLCYSCREGSQKECAVAHPPKPELIGVDNVYPHQKRETWRYFNPPMNCPMGYKPVNQEAGE